MSDRKQSTEDEAPNRRRRRRPVRRGRCRNCAACLRVNCRECIFCRDMKKYGGPGILRQTCVERRCEHPISPLQEEGESSSKNMKMKAEVKRSGVGDESSNNEDESSSDKNESTENK